MMTVERQAEPTQAVAGEASTEGELRRKAARRSLVCPGSGFALVGYRRLAIASFAISVAALLSFGWIALEPAAVPLYTAAALLAACALLAVLEQLAVKRASPCAVGPVLLVEQFGIASVAIWLLGAVALALIFTNFGSLRVAGPGMEPTFKPNAFLMYRKRVDWQAIRPGSVILFANASDAAWGKPGWLVVSRILAGPGDRLSIDGDNYTVNGPVASAVASLGSHKVRINVPSAPETVLVPGGCYFVVQDSPSQGLDSRVLSWVRKESIVGDTIWQVGKN
jgi:signal peptidase I